MSAPDSEPSVEQRRTLRVLMTGNVLQAMGLQLFVPILPIYLTDRGASSRWVGVTIAAGIAGYGLAQFPSGALADRFDRRSVVIWGMAAYAAFFLVYLFPIPVVIIPLVRIVHAGVGGLYSVASLAMLGDTTVPSRRGHVFGLWQATTRSGFVIGPLIGGVAATLDLSSAFIGSALVYGVATLVMLRLPHDPPQAHVEVAIASGPTFSARLLRSVLPLVAIAAAGDYASGAFNSIWSIWLTRQGAAPWQVGISFCLFAVPAVALSTLFGAISDRRGPVRIMVASLVGMVFVAPLCAVRAPVATLTAIGMLVGLFSTPNRPLVFVAATRDFSGRYLARAQGALQGGLMGVQFVAALLSGTLLGLSPTLAFGAISVVAVGSLAVAAQRRSDLRPVPT
jgi:MFS family permease